MTHLNISAGDCIEMILIEHLGSRRSGESRGGMKSDHDLNLKKKGSPLGVLTVHSYVNKSREY